MRSDIPCPTERARRAATRQSHWGVTARPQPGFPRLFAKRSHMTPKMKRSLRIARPIILKALGWPLTDSCVHISLRSRIRLIHLSDHFPILEECNMHHHDIRAPPWRRTHCRVRSLERNGCPTGQTKQAGITRRLGRPLPHERT